LPEEGVQPRVRAGIVDPAFPTAVVFALEQEAGEVGHFFPLVGRQGFAKFGDFGRTAWFQKFPDAADNFRDAAFLFKNRRGEERDGKSLLPIGLRGSASPPPPVAPDPGSLSDLIQ
jgi:hypothetical protein